MEEESQLSGMKILVVEDEPLVALASADFLADSGYTVAGPVSSVKLRTPRTITESQSGARPSD